MQTNFTWKRKLFSGTYEIYTGDRPIGFLKDKTFSKVSSGEINGRKYNFRVNGVFKQSAGIIDPVENSEIGTITFGKWRNKADITILGKSYNWKFDNSRNSRWSISGKEEAQISYKGSSTKGQIESGIDNELLLLSGLYVAHYFWHRTIVILIAVFIPIWISSFS